MHTGLQQTCKPASTDGEQTAMATWEANNGASRTEQQHPRREEERVGAADKHLHTKIFIGISANVGIRRTESRPKSGTRWGKYWTHGNFGKIFGLLLEHEISFVCPKINFGS